MGILAEYNGEGKWCNPEEAMDLPFLIKHEAREMVRWWRPKRMDRIRGTWRLKAERHILSKRCMVEYIPGGILRASFKFCMGDKLREKMEGGKRENSFFSAL
jgi:hypothetical protein